MPTLREIAALLGCPAPAGADWEVTGVATLGEALSTDISYISSDTFVRALATTAAGALIVQDRIRIPDDWTRPVLRVSDADLAVGKVLTAFAPAVPAPPVGIDPLARVQASALVADNAAVGPFVYVGPRSRIGSGTVLYPGVYVGADTIVGDDCRFFPNVVVRERITIGHRVIIHASSAIGSDGFGYRWDGRQHAKIPHVGTVIIEDDVEIGSCACVDRAKFSTTRIGRGSKIDNLVQIGHNAQVGPHCIITGQVGLAGSVTLGSGVVIGGQAAIRDHVTIGDSAMIAGASGVAEDVPPRQIFSGIPALPHRQSLREQKALRRLPSMQDQLRELAAEVERLKKLLGDGGPGTPA